MKINPYILTTLLQLIESLENPDLNIFKDQSHRLFDLVNMERAKIGIEPLIVNNKLNGLALMKSRDIVEKNYFSHQSPTHGSPFEMLQRHGINYAFAGENLAIDISSDKAHAALMNSEAHKKNILNPVFHQIGIGICLKGTDRYAFTQLFIG